MIQIKGIRDVPQLGKGHMMLYLLELSEIPEPNPDNVLRGKRYVYTSRTLDNYKGYIRLFLRYIGDTSLHLIEPAHIKGFCYWINTGKGHDSYKYNIVINVQRFVRWLKTKNVLVDDFNQHWAIVKPTATRKRIVPQVSGEILMRIKSAPKNTRDKAIMEAIFNGFRTAEICGMTWDNFPDGYFVKYTPGSYFIARRKGGHFQRCVLDRDGWAAFRVVWAESGCPVDSENFVFLNGKGGGMVPSQIAKMFAEHRNRVLGAPEFRVIREKITPHAIRHLWAQRFIIKHPKLAIQIGASLGGWTPNSQIYKDRYSNIEEIFPMIYGEAIGGKSIWEGGKNDEIS